MYGEEEEDNGGGGGGGDDDDKSAENDYDDVDIYNGDEKPDKKEVPRSSLLISEPPLAFDYKPLGDEDTTSCVMSDETSAKADSTKPTAAAAAAASAEPATAADNIVVEPTGATSTIIVGGGGGGGSGSGDDKKDKAKSTADMNQSNDNNNFQSEYELKFENIIPDLNEKQEYVVRMDSSITCTSF